MPPRPADDPARYALMEAALAFIEARRDDPPSLEEVATQAGLSPAHFQRAFSRWVGVSPKRYLQHLTLSHSRALLRSRISLLDATYEAGLSSPGRLHDLFLRWEAMTPGDYARDGAGLEIGWGWFDSPFGPALAMGTARGLCGLAFAADQGRAQVLADMQARWPAAAFNEDATRLRPWVEAAFGAGRPPVVAMGAPFQIKVWEALLAIPEGAFGAYGEIARAIGAPGAARAVGSAVGRNPLSWLIPCHRAIRGDGSLGGYHWGLPVKRAMLSYESARAEALNPAA